MRKSSIKIVWLAISAAIVLVASGTVHSRESDPLPADEIRRYELEEPPVLEHSLESYLRYAASQNPALRAAFHKWKAKLEQVSIARGLPDPQLSYSHFLESVETRLGPQEYKVSLRQTIPWFGTLGAKGDVAAREAEAAYYRLEALKQERMYQVKSAYIQYYLLGKQITIASENMELLKSLETALTARYETSLAANSDLIKLQVEMGRLEDRLATLDEKRKPLETEIRQLINAPDSVTLPLPDALPVAPGDLDTGEIKNLSLINNPNLKAIQKLAEREKAAVNLANKASLPEFMLGVGMIGTGKYDNPMLEDNGRDAWEVSVGVNLPVWFGKNKARKAEARSRLKSAEYHLESARNDLVVYAERVLFEYNNAGRKIRLYRDGLIPRAEVSFSTAYAAYQAGDGDFLSLIDAQRLLLEFQLDYEEALTARASKYAEIQMLISS